MIHLRRSTCCWPAESAVGVVQPAPPDLPSASAPPSVKREGFPETPVPCKSGPHPALNAAPSPRSRAAGGRAAGGSGGRPLPSRPGRVWPEGASAIRHRVTTREHTGVSPAASSQRRQPGGGGVEGPWAGPAAASLSASVLTELQYPDSTSACGCVLGLAISGNYGAFTAQAGALGTQTWPP